MATITVMKNFVMKKAQGSSDKSLKDFAKLLKNYGKLDVATKKKVSVATEKLYTKLKSEDSKPSTRKDPAKKGVTKKRIATQDLKSILAKFKAKVGAKAYKEAVSGTTIKQDAERPALKKGKRFVTKKGYTTNQYGTFKNQVGTAYWENRANRFDVKQPAKTFPKLAKGGKVADWKEFYEMSKDTSGYNSEYEKKFGSYIYQAPHIQEILEKSKSFEDFMNRKNRIESNKFAKGGITEHGLKVGDKIISSFSNAVVVENDKKKFVVNLNVGKRYTEAEWFTMNYKKTSKAEKE